MCWRLRILLAVVLFSMLSLSFVMPASDEVASASGFACPGPLERPEFAAAQVVTIDHSVLHVSTVPANDGELVCLSLRERVASNREVRKVVLMIHGASVPVLPGFELRTDHYDWALWLAQAGGFDVFMLDFQGSGLSPRPKMDDPCNVPTGQLGLLIPNPLATTPDAQNDFAYSTVATAPSPTTTGTSLVVQTGHGSRFPTPPFNAAVWPAGAQPDVRNAEIVRVTAISTDTLAITRAQEGSTARGIIAGDQIAACPPAHAFQLINSQSDWSELDTVVDYIRDLRGVDKVALVSWSQGSFRVGPYAVQHP